MTVRTPIFVLIILSAYAFCVTLLLARALYLLEDRRKLLDRTYDAWQREIDHHHKRAK